MLLVEKKIQVVMGKDPKPSLEYFFHEAKILLYKFKYILFFLLYSKGFSPQIIIM